MDIFILQTQRYGRRATKHVVGGRKRLSVYAVALKCGSIDIVDTAAEMLRADDILSIPKVFRMPLSSYPARTYFCRRLSESILPGSSKFRRRDLYSSARESLSAT